MSQDKKKEELLKQLNVEHTNIMGQRDHLITNSTGSKINGLIKYNAILDNITFGVNSRKTIKINGIELKIRPLSAEEEVEIEYEVLAKCDEHKRYEAIFKNYEWTRRYIAKALTPTPFKTEGESDGKPILNSEDLKHLTLVNLTIIAEEIKQFGEMAALSLTQLSNDELIDVIEVLKKNPQEKYTLEVWKHHAVSDWLLNYYVITEQMLASDSRS